MDKEEEGNRFVEKEKEEEEEGNKIVEEEGQPETPSKIKWFRHCKVTSKGSPLFLL